MTIYTITVISVTAVSALILLGIFKKYNVLNKRMVLAVTLASLISAFVLPGAFNIISANSNGSYELSTLLPVTVSTVSVIVILAFLVSVIIARAVPWEPVRQEAGEAAEAVREELAAVEEEITGAGANYLEQIYDTFTHENADADMDISPNPVETADFEENKSEISVDTSENIDKMGIENNLQDSENLTIEECIEEAFRLKEQNDYEGAILYYMYALDKRPARELTFWIILDICVMYKILGQYEMAFDILNSYNELYGDIMDVSVKKEIESNLYECRV